MKLVLAAFIAMMLLVPVLATAADDIYRFETTYQSAGNYHGSIFGLSSDVNVGPTTKLLPRAENLTRTFSGGPTFNETTITMDVAQKMTAHTYLIFGGSTTPNAVLNPNWNARLDPHYAFGNHDFGFRMAYAEYDDEQAGIFTPEYFYSLNEQWSFGEMIPCARADAWYCSSASTVLYKPVRRASVRLVPAFGRTLESAGAPATFTSISLEGAYEIARRFRIGIGGTNYDSTLRHERSVLLRLEAW